MTNSVGGRGGDGCWAYPPTWGGPGIHASKFSSGGLLELILCGAGGVGSATGSSGGAGTPTGGPGGSLVLAGNVLGQSSQMTYAPTPPSAAAGATYVVQPTIEPTLELIGGGLPGVTLTLRLRARPGTVARLNLGRTPALTAAPGVLVENLVVKERSFDRGSVPASGIIDTPWLTNVGAPIGKLLIFQAKVTDPLTGLTQKTNSIEVVVR